MGPFVGGGGGKNINPCYTGKCNETHQKTAYLVYGQWGALPT